MVLQPKLLQFLETFEYRRLGSTQPRNFSGRIMAATNRSLKDEVTAGRFRADLWYRLDVLSIHLPPLRERSDDVAELTEVLLGKLAEKHQRQKPFVKPTDLQVLLGYHFPGNVRELRNLLERSLLQMPNGAAWLELDRLWLQTITTAATPSPAVRPTSCSTSPE